MAAPRCLRHVRKVLSSLRGSAEHELLLAAWTSRGIDPTEAGDTATGLPDPGDPSKTGRPTSEMPVTSTPELAERVPASLRVALSLRPFLPAAWRNGKCYANGLSPSPEEA